MNEQLIQKLAKDEACKSSLLALRNMSIEEMLQLYIEKIDFSICSDVMNDDFFIANSTPEQRYAAGIYVNEKYSKVNPELDVLIGETKADILIDGYSVTQLFLRDNSVANVTAKDNAYVIIDCFNDTFVKINQSNQSTVTVNLYGNAKCEYAGNVKIVNKLKEKY